MLIGLIGTNLQFSKAPQIHMREGEQCGLRYIYRLVDLVAPRVVQGDGGYDHDKYRRPLHAAGIATEIARRGQPHGSGLGKTRWVVERTISWLHNFRRLRIRFERLAFIHEAFLKIACCIICWRQLRKAFC